MGQDVNSHAFVAAVACRAVQRAPDDSTHDKNVDFPTSESPSSRTVISGGSELYSIASRRCPADTIRYQGGFIFASTRVMRSDKHLGAEIGVSCTWSWQPESVAPSLAASTLLHTSSHICRPFYKTIANILRICSR
ncbi:hypothetical protein IG631_17183 [Alternaria alternata]|nr:hypothetical protein IG631_17183 [Alternaria alternata]